MILLQREVDFFYQNVRHSHKQYLQNHPIPVTVDAHVFSRIISSLNYFVLLENQFESQFSLHANINIQSYLLGILTTLLFKHVLNEP